MKREEIYERLNEVFRDVFDDESITVADETTAADVEGWDSLIHITLIEAVEEEFDIRFDMKTVVKLKNVGEMVDVIDKKCSV
ncbi:MAG: acyl carrier protein [Lachnospiraceae bacterium]|nr:acyl carrier protein [Lachnospiraceae bacterium]